MQTLNVDTSDMMRVERTLPTAVPTLDPPLKSPYYISQFPISSVVSVDAVNNFNIPNIPANRIVPPIPLNLSGAQNNAVPTAATIPARSPITPAPTIAAPLTSIAAGYTFSFNEVRLPLGSTFSIATYKIYRGPSSNSSLASVIDTIPHNPTQLSTPVVIQDNVASPVINFYFVSAVNSRGAESNLTPAQSGAVTNIAGFNANAQLASSFKNNAVNVSYVPTSSTVLSNNGLTSLVTVASSTNRFAPGTVSYNSGSFDPGLPGSYVCYADDPQFQGGAIIYQFADSTTGAATQVGSDARLVFGKITTSSAATTGGGFSGGTTGSGSGGLGSVGGKGYLIVS